MTKRIEWTEDKVQKVRDLAALGRSNRTIAIELGVSRSSIIGLKYRIGLPNDVRSAVADTPPESFADLAPTMGMREAARHYSACAETIRAWHRACGTEPKSVIRVRKPYVPVARKPKAPAPVALPRAWARPAGMTPMPAVPTRDDTVAAQAQYHLQRLYPVFRAVVTDASAPRDAWMVAGRRVTEAEMIQIAQRRGMKIAA